MSQEKRFWDDVEALHLEEQKELQLKRLQDLAIRVYNTSPFYRKKFDEAGVKPSDIKTLEDIHKLPITVGDDTKGKPVIDKLGILESEISVFSSTTGTTTGIPEHLVYNKNDVGLFLTGEARAKWAIGVRSDDIVQIMTR